MKIKAIAFMMMFLAVTAFSQEKKSAETSVKQWLKVSGLKVTKPAFSEVKNFKEKVFAEKQLFKSKFIDIAQLRPSAGDSFKWVSGATTWSAVEASSATAQGLTPQYESEVSYLASYVSTERWRKLKFQMSSKNMCELYVNGKFVVGNYAKSDSLPKSVKKVVNLKSGKHTIVIKTFGEKGKECFVETKIVEADSLGLEDVELSLKATDYIKLDHTLSGIKGRSASLSPSGEYVIMSYSQRVNKSDDTDYWKEVKELKSGKIVHTFRTSRLSNLGWLPKSDKISYLQKHKKQSDVFVYDLKSGKETLVARNIKKLRSISWAPNEQYFIYSITEDNTNKWKLKRLQGIEDRLSGYRKRSFLYKYDVASNMSQRLTYGKYSTSLNDISPDSRTIAFSSTRSDYSEYPFFKQNLYTLNLETLAVKTVWENRRFAGYVSFSPQGDKFLVQGGPSCFGKVGINNGDAPIPNNYDAQLYIYDIATKKVDAITYDFDPSVKSTYWNRNNSGNIYIHADVKDKTQLYVYNLKKRSFKLAPLQQESVASISYADNGRNAIYRACSMTERYKFYTLDLKKFKTSVYEDPEQNTYKDVKLGATKEWDFQKEDGTTIIGRMYYPPNFDKSKKYPMLVYYYGGTSPVGRSFGGRYPYNIWAARGYIVYVLQPTGATGFGQKFSAKHQNNWGIITADEIIDGTKRVIKAHSFIDGDNVGCLGASYGGFTTMLLQTKTDIFKAAVSHAGISSISSYWGEGDWGYSYSTNATGKKYPWNAKNIYVDQSPLFRADKFKNSILLFHGTVDNNVPPGESMQFYVALKLLGKDVEFIQVKDQQHFVLNLTQRTMWHHSILSYFDKHLKSQPQWWNNMWPDKEL